MPSPDPSPRSDATVVATVTAPGRAAIASLRVEGPSATCFIRQLLAPQDRDAFERTDLNQIQLRRWGTTTGEQVVIARRSPQVIEIHCHGGVAAAHDIQQSLEALGAIPLDWSSWIVRQPGGILAREAWTDLARATTVRCAQILLDQYHGALGRALATIIALLQHGDLAAADALIGELLQRAKLGSHLIIPFEIALVGPPNVGKSSLLNAIAGYDRAIVHNQPGTTRDVVSVLTAIDGWPCRVLDTAGVRHTRDALEEAGIQRAWKAANNADLAIICRASDEPDARWAESPEIPKFTSFTVATKSDLTTGQTGIGQVSTSALTGEGIDQLLAAISRRLVGHPPSPGAPIPFRPRHISALKNASQSLEGQQLHDAISVLQALLSEPASP